MSFTEITNVKFELNEILTIGVAKNKYGCYSIPIVLDTVTMEKIEELVAEHNTNNPLYGSILYLKSKELSDKQKKELLGKGKYNVMVHFKFTGVYTKDDNKYLVFKVTRLRPLSKPEKESDCPEDWKVERLKGWKTHMWIYEYIVYEYPNPIRFGYFEIINYANNL